MKMKTRRFELDFLRGFAIILMILFHFGYDLALYGYASYNTNVDIQWLIFRAVILSTFLLLVGMSSYLAYAHTINLKKLFYRSLKLLFVSGLISLGSYMVFAHSWIYFGVIHFILVATLASLLFVRIPNISLFVGIGFILSYNLGYVDLSSFRNLFVTHLGFPSHTVDLVSFFPWFGVVLIGIFLMHHNLFSFTIKENTQRQKLAFMGQHSLLIYLVHQPILFGVFEAVKFLRQWI
ncbi:DUF1624 domain-containing protein [Sulfurimonas sp. MAG313]|nr:heparan-alpha-glucosaminide N-acetyltransferase [Sulfurimonas sp. MAG313]MDF1880768.1 DUF1624 domain-containing protein [Sulfurimonas sp. MAG313]